ncbi:hypothetical protein Pint_30883 [Pistacia integerrima]|uniref:Uncharacterized protein n=1 Tax=Pistacia integerrima TaxID=434235 RepID=A0ACC0XMT2_9ROSI|nr:hypothetical protein Pint_30883 [Pistacia integerrima]
MCVNSKQRLKCRCITDGRTSKKRKTEAWRFDVTEMETPHYTLPTQNVLEAKHLFRSGLSAFKQYVEDYKLVGLDTIELNVGSLEVLEETLMRYVRLIKSAGLKVKPQFAVKLNKSTFPLVVIELLGLMLSLHLDRMVWF